MRGAPVRSGAGDPAPPAPAPAAADPRPSGPLAEVGEGPAARWLLALEELAGRAAHEINNALNGAVMNLEVVRLRARPGADAGAVAPFGEAAASQVGEAVALVGALLALARAPRDGRAGAVGAELGETLRHAVTLLAPVVAHRGVTLSAEVGPDPIPSAVDPRVARLAVTSALLAAAEVVAAAPGAELGGRATEGPERPLRCMFVSGDGPTLRLSGPGLPAEPALPEGAPAPAPPGALGESFDAALVALLQTAGVRVEPHAFALAFPPAGG